MRRCGVLISRRASDPGFGTIECFHDRLILTLGYIIIVMGSVTFCFWWTTSFVCSTSIFIHILSTQMWSITEFEMEFELVYVFFLFAILFQLFSFSFLFPPCWATAPQRVIFKTETEITSPKGPKRTIGAFTPEKKRKKREREREIVRNRGSERGWENRRVKE